MYVYVYAYMHMYNHCKAETNIYELIRKSVGMRTICSITELERRGEFHWLECYQKILQEVTSQVMVAGHCRHLWK